MIKHGDLNELLTIIKQERPEISSIKILANVTDLFYGAFEASKLNASEVEILLRRPLEGVDKNDEYRSFFNRMVKNWQGLRDISGQIKYLNIRCFDFLTPDWQVIIDEKFMIMGLNVPNNSWKKFEVFETVLIVGDSESGKSLIKKYANRFDRFFEEHSKELI